MPPPGSPSPSIGEQYSEPYYSNEDIELLHDIVVLAEALFPNLPEREKLPTNALFSAYYDIFNRLGRETDHDNRYARVLFKIGGQRGPGTFYEKFERVLARMGIEIEFDHQDDTDQSNRFGDQKPKTETVAIKSPPHDEKEDPRIHQRRNSESSAWNLGTHSQPRTRRNSFSSISQLKYKNGVDKRILQEPLPTINRPPPPSPQLQPISGNSTQNNVGAWLAAGQEEQRRGRGRSVSTHASMRIRRHLNAARPERPASPKITSYSESEGYQAESELTAVTSVLEGETNRGLVLYSDYSQPNDETKTILEIKAALFLKHRIESVARRELGAWKCKALQLHKRSGALDAAAVNHDERVLLRSAFDMWRNEAAEQHKQIETRRFYVHLEVRASRARDLYLLHVAFTHWASCANEQVQRTALARRHIIRTRIFNAWRDITAVNELKVRRQVLKKFFAAWKQHHLSVAENNFLAVQQYQGNLVERVYKQWIHNLWSLKATAWWAETLKRRTTFLWILASHNSWENNRIATEHRQFSLVWNVWTAWRTKTEIRVRQDQEADQYYINRVCGKLLKKWRHETGVIPAKITIQTEVEKRLLRDSLRVWAHRTRLEKLAEGTDRVKILREALTHWRLKFRALQVEAIVNRRVVQQSLHSWNVLRKVKDCQNWRMKRDCYQILQVWKNRMRESREHRWEQEDIAFSFAAQKAQNLVLRQWYSRMGTIQQSELVARELYQPRLLQGVVSNWAEKLQHVQKLQQWARDADYFLLASKTLKSWKASTEAAKREKRKVAYGQVRRTARMNLARGVFQNWRRKTLHTLDLHAQALDVRHNKDVIIGMEVFDRWRARAEEIAELESICRDYVLRKQFTVWKDRSEVFRALDNEAAASYEEQQQSRVLKKWNLQALQVRAKTNTALDVREKNAKRNFRKIFTYWHQKALQLRPVERVVVSSTTHLDNTARAETWSEFGEEADIEQWAKEIDVAAASTPLPGYLSTPSKRSERVMAVASRYSTTPKAPLSTPFERHLRAQWSGGALPPPRRGLGRSTLGMGGGFADIPETSMNNDQ